MSKKPYNPAISHPATLQPVHPPTLQPVHPATYQIMNANAFFGMGGLQQEEQSQKKQNQKKQREQKTQPAEQDIKSFIANIPADTLKKLNALIKKNKKEEALALACQYVVDYYKDVPYNICLHHGNFVYELLQAAHNSA